MTRKTASKDAVRQQRSREERAAEGGKQIAVMLTGQARHKLDAWVARGESQTGIVNKLLIRSKP